MSPAATLKGMLDEAVVRYGEKVAIVSGDCRLSYADLGKASDKVAGALAGLGVSKGDRVAMLLSNSPEFVATYFGIIKAGAMAVPLDTKYKVDELASLLNDCRPEVLVTESPVLEQITPVLSRFQSVRHLIDISSRYEAQFLSYRQIMATEPPASIIGEPEPDDIAYIAYTSGPTFDPRGIMLPHRQLVKQADISAVGFQQTDEDVLVQFALPMHHSVGLTIVVLASVSRGSKVVMLPGLSIPSLTETIERERATIFIGVPFVFALMVRTAEEEGIGHDLSSLRLCGSGGAPVPIDVMKRFRQLYGLDIMQFWGLTEATAQVTCQSVDGAGEPGSVGKALPGWEVKIVDDGDSQLLPYHEGEVIVRGPIMREYHNNAQATAEIIKDGWLYTGDIGKVDDDGHLFITGRKKDIIIVKGQNIHPSDIESVLSSHPGVTESAVIGIPDEMRGEVVGAVIALKEGEVTTEQEIKRFCLERIANYKVPKQVMFLDSLPRTTRGEVDKESIRRRFSIPPIF